MKNVLMFLIFFVICTLSFAKLKDVYKQELRFENQMKNAGFENVKAEHFYSPK